MEWSNRVQTKEFNLPSNVSSGAETQDFRKLPAFTWVYKLCYVQTISEFRLRLSLGIVTTTEEGEQSQAFWIKHPVWYVFKYFSQSWKQAIVFS